MNIMKKKRTNLENSRGIRPSEHLEGVLGEWLPHSLGNLLLVRHSLSRHSHI